MSSISFDDLGITTMTVVMPLRGSVDLDSIFRLFEIVRVTMDPPPRPTAKVKMPFLETPGAIISARYLGITRGLLKSRSKGFFRNSITIDMSSTTKNVNLKLSRNKIQMCGASSVAMALEAGNLMISNLLRVDADLTYLQEHLQETQEVVAWIKKTVKGDLCVIPLEDSEDSSSAPLIAHSIELPEAYPSDLDERILFFLLRQAPDYLSYDDYCQQLDNVLTLDPVITRPLDIISVKKVMVNYNYYLGCKIDRWALAQKINRLNGFTSRYDNTADYSVTIKLPYIPPSPTHSDVHRRANKNPSHIFIVYKSGKVTQTGPSEELMKQAYNLFNETIEKLKPSIAKYDESDSVEGAKLD